MTARARTRQPRKTGTSAKLVSGRVMSLSLSTEEKAHVRTWLERREMTLTDAVRRVDAQLRAANIPVTCTSLREGLLVIARHPGMRAYVATLAELRA